MPAALGAEAWLPTHTIEVRARTPQARHQSPRRGDDNTACEGAPHCVRNHNWGAPHTLPTGLSTTLRNLVGRCGVYGVSLENTAGRLDAE